MELTHLKYFVTVAEELHFGRAAKRLHIAQPPLSQQIMKLEDELEVKLFNRTSRRVTLTDAGGLFLKEARAILEQAETAARKIQELSLGNTGSLALGFSEPAINTFLSSAIKIYSKKYPKVKLLLYELETSDQLKALRTRKIDLGILRPFEHDLTGLKSKLLFSEKYLAAVPAQMAINKESINLIDLADHSFIMFPRSTHPALYDKLLQCCINAGFTPNISQEAVGKHTTLALVEAGLGVAIVPVSCSKLAPPTIKFLPINDNLPSVDIYAVWREYDELPALNHFLQAISEAI
jgi:DNA-binding transcriptional LysR family regulator